MADQLPDVQATRPDVTVGLGQVGVTGVEKLVEIARDEERPIVLMVEFDAVVDLPSWRKGADMSRNLEVVDETLEEAVEDDAYRVEDVCIDAAERLLEKHEYTTTAEVNMEAEYVMHERTPATDRRTQYSFDILASATATKAGTRTEIGVEVTGMTVCPCSQGMSAASARETLRELGVEEAAVETFLEEAPQPGHSQRGHATLALETDGDHDVDLQTLAGIARDAMSARIYNYAKRPDEDYMTRTAHENGRFVEDCVRAMAEGVVETFPELDDDTIVTMKQSNDESIHQHNAHAQRVVELGTLREEVAE